MPVCRHCGKTQATAEINRRSRACKDTAGCLKRTVSRADLTAHELRKKAAA